MIFKGGMMKRKILFFAMLAFFSWVVLADVAEITIVEPVTHGDPHIVEDWVSIRWTYSSYFADHPQNCTIFWGPHCIAMNVPVTSGQFWWTVAKKYDGTDLPQGYLQISIQCPDFTTSDGPWIPYCDFPIIHIVEPANGAYLKMNSFFTIQWTYSNWFDHVAGDHELIMCGPYEVAYPVKVKDAKFVWRVGQKRDGSFMPPGDYDIRLTDSGPTQIKIINTFSPRPVFHISNTYLVNRFPGCPMCFQFNPGQISTNEPVIIEIARGDKILARWNAGGRSVVLGPIKITFDADSFRLLDQETAGFVLRILSPEGKVLETKPIRLVTR
jgi:hypothetical protein